MANLTPTPVIATLSELLEYQSQVHDFYNTSFENLLWVIGAGFAVVGVVVPSVIAWYQNRNFKSQSNELKENISNLEKNISEQSEKLKDETEKLFKKMLEDERGRIQKSIVQAEGRIFHVQGLATLAEKRYSDAVQSYVDAMQCYSKAGDAANFKICLENSLVVLNSNSVTFDAAKMDRVNKLVERLKLQPTDSVFFNSVEELEKIKTKLTAK